MRWSNYEFRRPDPDLPPETSYMQGAPGIGSTLLARGPAPGRGRMDRPLAARPVLDRTPGPTVR